jgi:hypothetical protein
VANDLLLVPMLFGGERGDCRHGLRDRHIQGSGCADQLGQRRTIVRNPLAELLDFPFRGENSA